MDRRSFLGMGLTGAAGAAVGVNATLAANAVRERNSAGDLGTATQPFYGDHQAGIESPPQSHGTLIAFTLRQGTDAAALQRLLRVWSTDAALLMQGKPSMGDAAGTLAVTPASLTVTIGLGYGAFELAGMQAKWPARIIGLPSFAIDRLQPEWTQGDVVLQVAAHDPTTVSHAVRELMKDARPFADVAWQQSGFMPTPGYNPGQTARNLMGFLDGSRNPAPGTDVFATTVWNDGAQQPWFAGGTMMAMRRIRINLDTWEKLDIAKQEAAFGRRLESGAPLSGGSELTTPDLAKTKAGKPVIPTDSHVRRSTTDRRIYRRPFNYDDGFTAEGINDVGLIFVSFQADIDQFVEVQTRLSELDALNTWTTPIGSAFFVIPPGTTSADGWIGETLFA